MLRREVITDPNQIRPLGEQVRSVMPWWRRWLGALLLVAGCTTAPPTDTLGEAAEELAFGLCSRWITCGTTDQQWQQCVADLVWDFCGTFDCGVTYPDYKWDNLTRCVDWYVEQSCSLYVEPCGL